jgi:hypothetical protein
LHDQIFPRFIEKTRIAIEYELHPSGAHAMVARDALNAGKHAVSTKPMETTVACDGLQGRRAVLVNQAIYECARTGKPVRVDK